MDAAVEHIKRVAWIAIEAAFLLILLCVLLNIILGEDSGSFIAAVAGNTIRFLQAVPPGSLLGIALVVLLYAFWRFRTR